MISHAPGGKLPVSGISGTSCHPGQVLISTQTVTHEYLTLSGKVARETVKKNGSVTDVLDFVYDESGRPFALIHQTDGVGITLCTYYYVLNLQGDVVKLVTASGDVVANYEYDAWGNILSQSGEMASINPLRYRGYYYDGETGFYYLQSRYYDPVNRRFINADSYASTGQGFVGTNMFAYCNNNPAVYADPAGAAADPRFNTTAICDNGGKLSFDRTEELIAQLQQNYDQAVIWRWEFSGPISFYNHVKDKGKWDYKTQISNTEWIPDNGVFKVFGKRMTVEQLGNLNYGFTGSAVHFPAPILRMAGGIVAIKNNGINWSDWWYDFDS